MKRLILLAIALIFIIACSSDEKIEIPPTEDGWYSAIKQLPECQQERRLAILLKVIHMRYDSIVTRLNIEEPNIDQLTTLKDTIHTKEWNEWRISKSSFDPRLKSIHTLADNLYIRLKNLDEELDAAGYKFESPLEPIDTGGVALDDTDMEKIQKIITEYLKNKSSNSSSGSSSNWGSGSSSNWGSNW